MGKAARLKRQRKANQALLSQLHLRQVEMLRSGEFNALLDCDDYQGASIECTFENSSTYSRISEPLQLIGRRSPDEQSELQQTLDLFAKKLDNAASEHMARIDQNLHDVIRTLIWRSDILRKYIRQYEVFIDADEDAPIMFDLGFSANIGDGKYFTFWVDDVLSSDECEYSATRGHIEELSKDGICPHCQRLRGAVEELTWDEAANESDRAIEISKALRVLVKELREAVPMEVFPRLVRDLTARFETNPKGNWTREETIFPNPCASNQLSDCKKCEFFDECGGEDVKEPDDVWTTYIFEAAAREKDVPTYSIEDIDDDDVKTSRKDISKDISNITPGAHRKWVLPKGYFDIAHGTVYIDDTKSTKLDARKTRYVLTDSIDEVAVIVDEKSGKQEVEDRALADEEDPIELVRFVLRCEEITRDGQPAEFDEWQREAKQGAHRR